MHGGTAEATVAANVPVVVEATIAEAGLASKHPVGTDALPRPSPALARSVFDTGEASANTKYFNGQAAANHAGCSVRRPGEVVLVGRMISPNAMSDEVGMYVSNTE